MNESDLVRNQVSVILGNMQYLIRLLYATQYDQTRYLALNDLWHQVKSLEFLIHLLDQAPGAPAAAPALTQPTELRTITQQELASATGRAGNPAYVAVNGTVYDVTNHAGWSLGTHFGLPAGRDLTKEFASCHAGQQWILPTLQPVGRLV